MRKSLDFFSIHCKIVNMKRYQKEAIIEDLNKKMVFLTGPRQAGKTTLAKEVAKHFPNSVYLNFDHREDREMMRQESWPQASDLLILDEIQKMPKWKNYLKGLYDTKPEHRKILVTGSARLEVFNQVGDSLAGRFFLHRLLPLSPAELIKVGMPSDLERFLERGGFPEPYLSDTVLDANRWRLQYVDSLLRVDVLDFENIHHLKSMRLIFDLLRERVGSPVSYTSLSEDAGISPNTVKKYIEILEALYIVFRVTPYAKNIARSLHKEPKIYFFDTALVSGGSGARLENLVATCLLKDIYYKVDYLAEPHKLHYVKTKEGKEVDFALIKNGKVEKVIEVKTKNSDLSEGLKYFHAKYQLPSLQIVKELRLERLEKGIEILRIENFLESLAL